MPFELKKVLEERRGENFTLHSKYINPQLPRVLGTIEFDRFFERGEGCYLIDDKGERYLDFLSGFGVFALGRGHPAIVQALHDALDADLPNLVQMDCALLPGVLAEERGVRRSRPLPSLSSMPSLKSCSSNSDWASFLGSFIICSMAFIA